MSTPEKPTEPQSPLNFGSAILSFILPGVGQLVQKRSDAFIGHLLLYGLSAALPYALIYDFWRGLPTFFRQEIAPVLLLLPLPLLTILFSALDAALWKSGEPSRLRRPIRTLATVFVCIYVAMLFIMPMISAAREAARRMQCTGQMKYLVLVGMYNYHDQYKSFPPAYTVDESGKPLHSWRVLILPFLESTELKELYDDIRLDEPWDSEHNRQFHSREPHLFQCPSDRDTGMRAFLSGRFNKLLLSDLNCNYSVVVGEQTIFPDSKTTHFGNVSDGLSNTILIVERMFPICWMDPTHEITFDDACRGINAGVYGPGSGHVGGCNMAIADGSVRYISETIEPETLKGLLTKAGGESVTNW